MTIRLACARGLGARFHNESLFDAMAPSDWAAVASALGEHYPEQAEELRGLAVDFLRVYGEAVSFEYLAGDQGGRARPVGCPCGQAVWVSSRVGVGA